MVGSLNDPCNRITEIPTDLKMLLSRFAIEYLTLRPPDVNEFGMQFFTQSMQKSRSSIKRRSSASCRLSVVLDSDCSSGAEIDNSSEGCQSARRSTRMAKISQTLMKSDYFENHSCDSVFSAVTMMYSVTKDEGENIELNDDGTLYVIEEGILSVKADDLHEIICEDLGSFSLMQLRWKYGRSDLTITAESDCTMWILDDAAFKRCWIGDVHVKCRDYESILEFSPIFGELDEVERRMLADLMTTKRYDPKDLIYDTETAEMEAPGCFFIIEGMVSLLTSDDDGGIQTVLLKSGQHFGEITAKDEMILRSANAVTNVRCAHLNARAVRDLMQHPFAKQRPNLCSRCKNEF